MREITRGEILRQLGFLYPESVTPGSLLELMELADHPVMDRDLLFHLHYLLDKGFVDLRYAEHVVGQPDRIRSVRVTTKGIDLLDRRGSGDLGVRISARSELAE